MPIPLLIESLGDPNTDVRSEAIIGLKNSFSKVAGNQLIDAMDTSTRAIVRVGVARTLVGIDPSNDV